MVTTRVNLAIVGFFVIAAGASLIVVLAILAGRTGTTDRYFTVYPNVSGLKFGSQVLYEGFPVGQVEEIEPVEKDGHISFRVEMSVIGGWKIPEDSVARSEAAGLLAPQTVSIAAGESSKMLEPGQMIPPGETAGLLASVSSVAGNVDEITDRAILPLVDNLNRQVTLFGTLLEHDVKPFLANANMVMAEASTRLPSILTRVDTAAGELSQASRQLNSLLSTEGVAGLDRLLQDAASATASLESTAAELDSLMATSGPDLQVGAQEFRMTMESLSRHSEPFAQNLDATARNLQEFSRQLRQNPGLLLSGSDRPDDPVPPYRPEE